jgi:hypothetical protein
MTTKRRAAAFAALAFTVLAAGCAAALIFGRLEVPLVSAGYVVYLALGRQAVILWSLDDAAFDHGRGPRTGTRGGSVARLVAATVFLSAFTLPLLGQQTIFNVPSADVLDAGKVYLEVDELFRPTEPKFSSTTVRGVVGVLPGMEAGVNFGGLNAPGPVIPTATVAVKLQPVHTGDFTLTAGGYGLFFLEAGEDGNPAGLGYGFASYRIPKLGTRIEFGGWYASAGYAKPASTGGALATFEQPLPWVQGLSLAADWWSGVNTIGYVSPGLIYTFGHWTAYASYSIKNGDSKGNAGLIELGYAF